MTIPRLRGIGDILGEDLPQIGSSIANLINPNLDMQRALKESIIRNPQLMDYYVNMERTTPGSTGIFGKQAKAYFERGELSDTFKENQKQEKLATKQSEQAVRANDQSYETNALRLDALRRTESFFQNLDPEAQNDALFKQVFGQLPFEYETFKKDAQRNWSLKNRAMPLLQLDDKAILSKYDAGELKGDDLFGIYLNDPNTYNRLTETLNFRRNDKLRRDLAREARANNRADVNEALFKQMSPIALQLGVEPADMFYAINGFEAVDAVPGLKTRKSTPEGVQKFREAQDMQERKKLLPVENALRATLKLLTTTKNLDKDISAFYISDANSKLGELNSPYKLMPKKGFISNFKKDVMIVDVQTGKEVTHEQFEANMLGGESKSESEVPQQMLDDWKAASPEQRAALERANPTLAAKIKKAIKP